MTKRPDSRKAAAPGIGSGRTPRFGGDAGARSAGSLGIGIVALSALSAACGGSPVEFAAPSAEEERIWEGIGYVGRLGDTAYIANIPGNQVETPALSTVIGDLRWTVTSVRNVHRGITRAWSSIEERWVGVDLRVEPAAAAATDTRTSRAPDTVGVVLLRQQVVMIDDHGLRHHPMIVHDRLRPLIDEPIAVDSRGLTTTLFFGIHREHTPAAVEIHAPLGSARLEWKKPEPPGDWIPLNRKALMEDRAGHALWEITLRRVRPIFVNGAETGDFEAEVLARNITRQAAAAPDPALSRLYTGSGRTLLCQNSGESSALEPGQVKVLTLRFSGVPRRESLELIIPTSAAAARIDALPGFFPERPDAMTRPSVSEGIRVAEYTSRSTGGFAVRIGLLNNGATDLNAAGLVITGLMDRTGAAVPGLIRDAPRTLYTGFEERRWVEFSSVVSAIRVELPGRAPILLKL
jgi:hypothetical protein